MAVTLSCVFLLLSSMFFNTAVYVTCLEIRNKLNKDGEKSLSKAYTAPPKKVRLKTLLVSNFMFWQDILSLAFFFKFLIFGFGPGFYDLPFLLK